MSLFWVVTNILQHNPNRLAALNIIREAEWCRYFPTCFSFCENLFDFHSTCESSDIAEADQRIAYLCLGDVFVVFFSRRAEPQESVSRCIRELLGLRE